MELGFEVFGYGACESASRDPCVAARRSACRRDAVAGDDLGAGGEGAGCVQPSAGAEEAMGGDGRPDANGEAGVV